MIGQQLLAGTFEADGGGSGAGINLATGMVSFDPNLNILFAGGQATVTGIFTIVGQSDDTCSFT